MRETRRLSEDDVRRRPWKNGRGVTEELVLWPPEASFERGDYEWRLARAGVDADGPFSVFPGFDRVLVLTQGVGLALRHGAAAAVGVGLLEPHRFSGDDLTQAELIAGPVSDVNLLARRGRVAGDVSVVRLDEPRRELLGAEHTLVHVLAGRVGARIAGHGALEMLSRRESLWFRGPEPGDTLDLDGRSGLALLVRIGPAAT